MKWELEDLAFKVLEPERFRELAKLLDTRRKGRETYIERAIAELKPKLEAAGIDADLQGRPKHIYSIWKKMERKGAEFGEIYDVYAIRILVDEVRDCYAALGIVHSIWRPIPGQFDDYIAVPKNNLYQSLHTAVIALDGKPLEIQIRTQAMHQVSRGRYRRALALQGRHQVRPRVRRQARLAAPADRLAARRLGRDRVRRGHQARHLPGPGLRVHPEGRHQGPAGRRDAARLRLPHPHRRRSPDDRGEGQQPARPARLPAQERRHRRDRDDQGRARPVARLDERRPDQPRPREDPPMVQAQGPRREHRPRPRVARARAAPPGADVDRGGRADQIADVARAATTTTRSTTSTPRSATARSAPQTVVMRLGVVDDVQSTLPTVAPPQRLERTGGVRVKGVGDLLVRFAKCCHPIPGDPIVGFITRGKGVTVHLQTCPTVHQRARGQPAHRRRVGIRADRDVPDRHPGRGLRPDRPAERHHPGRGREQGQHRRRARRRDAGPHGRRDGHHPGRTPCRSWPASWAGSRRSRTSSPSSATSVELRDASPPHHGHATIWSSIRVVGLPAGSISTDPDDAAACSTVQPGVRRP